MWEKRPGGWDEGFGRPVPYDRNGALTYANELTLGGYTDWRLANILQLISLINFGQSDMMGWLESQGFDIVPQKNLSAYAFWSSTPMRYNSYDQWQIWADPLMITAVDGTNNKRYAWAVRSGYND
jgi:hypothetical protein